MLPKLQFLKSGGLELVVTGCPAHFCTEYLIYGEIVWATFLTLGFDALIIYVVFVALVNYSHSSNTFQLHIQGFGYVNPSK